MRALLALLVLASLALSASPVAADWASFHYDSLNTGFVKDSQYPVYEDVWWNNKTLANAQIKASPVLKDGILVTADLAGLVRGLDAESGHELWRYAMPASVEGTPAIAGQRVYVVDTLGDLKALNLQDGRVETSVVTPVGATYGSVREHQGKLFIGNEQGQLKAYLESSLTLLWTFDLRDVYTAATVASPTSPPTCNAVDSVSPQPIRGAPAVFGGRVFFGSLNHYIFAVDEEGEGNLHTTLKWMYRTGDVVIASPTIDILDSSTHRVMVGSYDGTMYAFDAAADATVATCNSGGAVYSTPLSTPLWKFQVPSGINAVTGETQISKIESSPANSGDKVYFGANNGHVYAVHSSDGTQAWEQADTGSALRPVTSSPAVAAGIVVVGGEDKKVYWLSADDGHILKSFPAQEAMKTSPAIDGDRAFIAAIDGTLYMFGPKVPPRPDLVIDSISASPNGVSVVVKNIGTTASVATKVRLLMDGTLLADLDLKDPIAATQAATVAYSGTVIPGVHSFTAIADFGTPDLVKESNESNNSLTTSISIANPAVPVVDTTTSGKKGPGAGVGLLLVLVLAAVAARRRVA